MKHFFTGLFLLSILLAGDDICAQGEKPLYTAPFGVQAYTFRKSFPNNVVATLDSIKWMGFTEIEGGGGRIAPEEFRKLCEDRGISIPSTGTSYELLVRAPDSVAWRA